METGFYMDATVLAGDQTLIRMKSKADVVEVPAMAGEMRVMTAGSGAVIVPNAKKVSFEPGYMKLNTGCICAGQEMKILHIPETVTDIAEHMLSGVQTGQMVLNLHRAMTEREYREMENEAIAIGADRKLIQVSTATAAKNGMEPLRCLMMNIAPPAVIRPGMRILFSERQSGTITERNPKDEYSGTPAVRRKCIDMKRHRTWESEQNAVAEMILEEDDGWRDPAAEKNADERIRTGKKPEEGWRAVTIAEYGTAEPGEDGKYHICFNVRGEKMFYPAVRRFRHGGQDWWIYSRNYITSDEKCPYLREEVAVFSRDGLVAEKKIAEDVYAKYRFLAML